jgi:thiamine biosynthesis protein ThiS
MIILNGQAVETPVGLTLAGLLKERKLPAAELIVELNGAILEKRSGFDAVELRDQDRLNLFRIVTGG